MDITRVNVLSRLVVVLEAIQEVSMGEINLKHCIESGEVKEETNRGPIKGPVLRDSVLSMM